MNQIKRYRRKNTAKVDQNNLYGMYYDVNGDRIDRGVSEVVDSNDYYEAGFGYSTFNLCAWSI